MLSLIYMDKRVKWLIFFLLFINLILCAWSVLHKDIFYYTDIGRDFLIFDEIAAKKLVLFGPRADAQGLFHGILWYYLNMPAYFIARGNPVMVGWFWILLTGVFFASVYVTMKKLFEQKTALIAVLLSSIAMVPIAQGFFHGNGAMLVLPMFIYLFIRYMQTSNPWYLAGHLFVSGMLVQFEIALGGPLAILSTVACLFLIIRKKKFTHLICFVALVVFASTFLLADLRHDFLQVRSLLAYSKGTRDGLSIPFIESLQDRLFNIVTHGFNFFRDPYHKYNAVIAIFFVVSLFKIYKKHDKKFHIYTTFLYFYVGYYALTLLHGGHIIMFWWLPMSVFPILILSTLHRYTPKWIYCGLIAIILFVSGYQNLLFIKQVSADLGKKTSSWRLHIDNAKKVLEDAPVEFGYFVYAPDIFAYQDKYAMAYAEKLYPAKKAYRFIKKTVTYVLIEPAPSFRPEMGFESDLWIKNDVAISSKPVKIIPLRGGYQVNKYVLSQEDLDAFAKISPSDWLFYR